MPELTFRPGTPDDTYTTFLIFEESFADLWQRLGNDEPTSFGNPEALARMWEERRTLYEHIVTHADQFWLAEVDGVPAGFARSLRRGEEMPVRMLTEFFVRPSVQSSGAGKGLLARTFAAEEGVHRLVIASPDVRAQALYLRSGVRQRCSIYYFFREPQEREAHGELEAVPLDSGADTLRLLDALDREILGFTRTPEHRFLLDDRPGYLYVRRGRAVGYGYAGRRAGPFALLEPQDGPAALAHAETAAARAGYRHFGVEVPMANHAAFDYLLAHGFYIEPFYAQLLADAPFGLWDRIIVTSPPFIL